MSESGVVGKGWSETTKALILGFIGLNVLLHQAFLRGIGAPEGASQLMMWVTVVGVVSYAMARSGLTVGYWLAALTGVVGLLFTGLVGSGLLGTLPTDGPLVGFVLGPVAYAVYAVGLVVVGYMAVREQRQQSGRSAILGEQTAGAQ